MRTRTLVALAVLAVDVAVIVAATVLHKPAAFIVALVALVAGYNYLAHTRRARKGR